ncbi:MAG: alpha/beta hydrolase [Verrucomicrobia bacterium]|nr:alpha/beta hydrolase [Verrucomicrobiota bacterium]
MCTMIMLAIALCLTAGAQDGGGRGGLLRTWMKKKQDEKKIEAQAVGVTTKLDVAYLNDGMSAHKLDVYCPPKNSKPLPVLVHIHGGGWEIGDKKLMKSTGLFYASQGVLFITPNYRLSPKFKHPAHVEDCAAALAWACNHATELGGDKNRVFLSGHSAGAHLAALLGTDPAYLQKHELKSGDLAGVIPVDTASFDLTSADNEKLVKNFIRNSFGEDPQVLKSASPLHHVSSKGRYPAFLIFNTTNRAAAAEGGRKFAEALRGAGCNVRFVAVSNHTHGEMASGMYEPSDPVGNAILKFISP